MSDSLLQRYFSSIEFSISVLVFSELSLDALVRFPYLFHYFALYELSLESAQMNSTPAQFAYGVWPQQCAQEISYHFHIEKHDWFVSVSGIYIIAVVSYAFVPSLAEESRIV